MTVLYVVFALAVIAMVLGAWFGRGQLLEHPIRAFALLCVAVIAGYVMWMGYRLNETLSGPGWCRTALGAEKTSGKVDEIQGLTACVALLQIQLKSLATNSHILFGVLSGCLLVLIVIVIAGGKLGFTTPWGSAEMGKELAKRAAAAAADRVAGAAENSATQIKTETAATPPAEPPTGPAMPPPQ